MFEYLSQSLYEFDIGISKYSNFESNKFQLISAIFSDWGSLHSSQSEISD